MGSRTRLPGAAAFPAKYFGTKHRRGRRPTQVRAGGRAKVLCSARVEARRGALRDAGRHSNQTAASGIAGLRVGAGVLGEAGGPALVGSLPLAKRRIKSEDRGVALLVLLCHKLNDDDNTPGSMEAAALEIARSGCAASRSNGGYAVGREPFAPRSRNVGGSGPARNLRWPTWAEGEKRHLSAIKKPYAAMQSVAWW